MGNLGKFTKCKLRKKINQECIVRHRMEVIDGVKEEGDTIFVVDIFVERGDFWFGYKTKSGRIAETGFAVEGKGKIRSYKGMCEAMIDFLIPTNGFDEIFVLSDKHMIEYKRELGSKSF